MPRDPNETSDDRKWKPSFNVPKEWKGIIEGRCKELDKPNFSEYIRFLIKNDLKERKSLIQLLGVPVKPVIDRLDEGVRVLKGIDPPKRYHDFIDGLLRNSFWLGAWKEKRKKFLDNQYELF